VSEKEWRAGGSEPTWIWVSSRDVSVFRQDLADDLLHDRGMLRSGCMPRTAQSSAHQTISEMWAGGQNRKGE
jgi:hypothetical protein